MPVQSQSLKKIFIAVSPPEASLPGAPFFYRALYAECCDKHEVTRISEII